MADGLRAVVLLSLCAVSLVLFAFECATESIGGFTSGNVLAFAARRWLLTDMVVAGLAAAAAAAGYALLRGRPAQATLVRAAHLAAPLLMLAALPPLLAIGAWDDLTAALTIAAFTLLLQQTLVVHFSARERMGDLPRPALGRQAFRQRARGAAVVVAGACFYAFYMAWQTINNHRSFGTFGYDLGQYDNIFWSTLHGHWLRCAPLGLLKNWSELANHAELSVFFLLPFYAIHPRAETLLVIQAVVLAIGAVPIYLFASRRLPASYAVAMALSYLAYPPLHGANFYDFHFQPLAATFILLLIYFVDVRRYVWATLFAVIAIGCREDISVGLTLLGIFYALSGYRVVPGALLAVLGAVYFVVMRFMVMPMFGTSWFADIFKDLYPMPDGPRSFGGVMVTLVTNPVYVFRTLLTADKLRYLAQVAGPVAFLPLRRPALWVALVPGFIFTLLTTGYGPTIDIGFQYSGHFTAYIFVASAIAIASYDGWAQRRAALGALVAGTLLCTTHWGALPPHRFIRSGFQTVYLHAPSAENVRKAHDLAELDAMIPRDATVSVSEQEMPHVSGRLNVLTLRTATNGADYLLYGAGSAGESVARQAHDTGEYVELATRPGLALLRRTQLGR